MSVLISKNQQIRLLKKSNTHSVAWQCMLVGAIHGTFLNYNTFVSTNVYYLASLFCISSDKLVQMQ